MVNLIKLLRTLTPIQSLVLGYIVIILIGAILLSLPFSSSNGTFQPFVDALFTATSAISTTGLIVVDTGSYYNMFGQIVILFLLQIGGLGYMVFIVLMAYVFGRRPSLRNGFALQESLVGVTLGNIKKFTFAVIAFTLIFEFIGAFILALFWKNHFPLSRSIYLGVFHSISGFCTAGFCLFSDSFTSYQGSVVINSILYIICIAGGIGFFVLYDIYHLFKKIIRNEWPRQISVHSRFVLLLTLIIIIIGVWLIFISEPGISSYSLKDKLLTSMFQAISASTGTGFNTLNIGSMGIFSLFIIIILMYIGASPGGTGGGIKTTTFGTMMLSLIGTLRGRQPNVFKRQIPLLTINKAFVIAFMSLTWVIFATLILTLTEKASFMQILFEVVSGWGTVGLSIGITTHLTIFGRIIISLSMLIGRIGPLAIGLSLIGKPKASFINYAEGEIYVG